MVRQYFQDRAISDIISPFSAEQCNALTTKLAGPMIGQREVLYVEANGGADEVRKARIREKLWERCIRGPYTQWSVESWKAWRDVVVKSRGYLEVCHLTLEEKRRRYTYNPVKLMTNAILSGFMKLLGQDGAGTIRMSEMKTVTLWDGPIIRSLPFGTVYRDPQDTVLSENSRWVAVKYSWTYQEIVDEAKRIFKKGDKSVLIPFDEKVLSVSRGSTEVIKENSPIMRRQRDVAPVTEAAPEYAPYDVIVWKGIDPMGEPDCRYIYWVVNGMTIGAKEHDGSGPWNNIVELVWDPMNDFSTSMSPVMMIRRIQEMDSMLLSDGIDAATWESHPGGLVNELVVNDIEQIRNMRPSEYVTKMGDGQALERIQLGGNSMQTLQHGATVREIGRLATGGIASVVGASPVGANTATEFQGISQGAMGRLELQQEINAETCMKRLFPLVIADWRDSIDDDATLERIVGDDGTLGDITMEDLDDDMECIPMASRYQMVRQAELAAMKSLKLDMQTDPYLAAKIKKEEFYDDYVYAAAGGPRGWRWARTASEMAQMGMTPQDLEQLQVQNAAQSGGQGGGQPSQAKLPSAQPSQVLPTENQ